MVKNLKNTPEKRKIGESIFFIEKYSEEIKEGKITEFSTIKINNKSEGYVNVKVKNFGSTGVLFSYAFITIEDAKEFHKREKEEKLNTYRKQIHSIEDLVKFMYANTVSLAEEYTDWNAREVVEEKAKEFGINLSK